MRNFRDIIALEQTRLTLGKTNAAGGRGPSRHAALAFLKRIKSEVLSTLRAGSPVVEKLPEWELSRARMLTPPVFSCHPLRRSQS